MSRLPCGYIYGMLFGETYFCPYGSSYIYDEKNQIVSCYTVEDDGVDLLRGLIGKLNYQAWESFMKLMKDNSKKAE